MNTLLVATNVPQAVTDLVNSKEGIQRGCPNRGWRYGVARGAGPRDVARGTRDYRRSN